MFSTGSRTTRPGRGRRRSSPWTPPPTTPPPSPTRTPLTSVPTVSVTITSLATQTVLLMCLMVIDLVILFCFLGFVLVANSWVNFYVCRAFCCFSWYLRCWQWLWCWWCSYAHGDKHQSKLEPVLNLKLTNLSAKVRGEHAFRF